MIKKSNLSFDYPYLVFGGLGAGAAGVGLGILQNVLFSDYPYYKKDYSSGKWNDPTLPVEVTLRLAKKREENQKDTNKINRLRASASDYESDYDLNKFSSDDSSINFMNALIKKAFDFGIIGEYPYISLPLMATLGGAGYLYGKYKTKNVIKDIENDLLLKKKMKAKREFEEALVEQQQALKKASVFDLLGWGIGGYAAYKILENILKGQSAFSSAAEEYDSALTWDREREDRAQRAYAHQFRDNIPVRINVSKSPVPLDK